MQQQSGGGQHAQQPLAGLLMRLMTLQPHLVVEVKLMKCPEYINVSYALMLVKTFGSESANLEALICSSGKPRRDVQHKGSTNP